MSHAMESVNRVATKVARAPMGGDTLDLSQEMVDLMAARRSFEANVKVAQTGDEMTKALLDSIR
jgi:flagellar hook protein FlgE